MIIQDAGLEYDPAEITGVIAPILDGQADVVFGSRFLVKKVMRDLYHYHYFGNKLITFLFNLATNIIVTEVETCHGNAATLSGQSSALAAPTSERKK